MIMRELHSDSYTLWQHIELILNCAGHREYTYTRKLPALRADELVGETKEIESPLGRVKPQADALA